MKREQLHKIKQINHLQTTDDEHVTQLSILQN